MHSTTRGFALAGLGLLLAACGDSTSERSAGPEMPRFEGAELGLGRGVWMQTCRNCHLLGVSGAPAVTDYAAWSPRLEKGKPALYASALNGRTGPSGNQMPPRGGNAQLSDQQVKRAVDYMVAAVEHFHERTGD